MFVLASSFVVALGVVRWSLLFLQKHPTPNKDHLCKKKSIRPLSDLFYFLCAHKFAFEFVLHSPVLVPVLSFSLFCCRDKKNPKSENKASSKKTLISIDLDIYLSFRSSKRRTKMALALRCGRALCSDMTSILGARASSRISFSGESTTEILTADAKFGAQIYHPLPVVFSKASGALVWDPEEREYIDMLSAYSAVNQGHCHPRLLKTLTEQAARCTLPSRAFQNDVWPTYARKLNQLFGYERALPMNTGAEAVETAVKLARRWAYDVKGVPANEALIVSAKDCFHGRTILAISLSSDPSAFTGFGPYVPNIRKVDYDNIDALRSLFEAEGSSIAGFIVEPIQGEAGIIVPSEGYLKAVAELCAKHNVLFIADEIQTGLGRTGKLLAHYWDDVRPDIVLLGKALSGGLLPVSAVLADDRIMSVIKPGEHGSTYGGNPLGAAVAITALDILVDEGLSERAHLLGQKFRDSVMAIPSKAIAAVRGRGLLNAVDIDHSQGRSAWRICEQLKDGGVLAKPTHEKSIRFAPPLVITDEQLDRALGVIHDTLVRDA